MISSHQLHTASANNSATKNGQRHTALVMLRPVALCVLLTICAGKTAQAEDVVQFNTDVLDVKDRSRIDVNQFSRAGYLMPGDYNLVLRVNKTELSEQKVSYIAPDDDPKGSEACLTPEMVAMFGLKDSATRNLTWWHDVLPI